MKWTLGTDLYPETHWSSEDFETAVARTLEEAVSGYDPLEGEGPYLDVMVVGFTRPDPDRVSEYMLECVLEGLREPQILVDPELAGDLDGEVDIDSVISEADKEALAGIVSRYVQNSGITDRLPYQACGEVFYVDLQDDPVPYYCLWRYDAFNKAVMTSSEYDFGSRLTVDTPSCDIRVFVNPDAQEGFTAELATPKRKRRVKGSTMLEAVENLREIADPLCLEFLDKVLGHQTKWRMW